MTGKRADATARDIGPADGDDHRVSDEGDFAPP
jgi:hypothetical protein